MDTKQLVYCRWSDLKSVTVPFRLDGPQSITDALDRFHARTERVAHLHVLAGRTWINPAHNLSVSSAALIRRRNGDMAPFENQDGYGKSGNPAWPVSMPHMTTHGASAGDLQFVAERCAEAAWVWGDPSLSQEEYESIALRSDTEIMRDDVRANIRRRLNDDYLPPTLGELRHFAQRAGLLPDFDRAWPEIALAARGGAATKGVSTPAKRRAAQENGKRGGRPRKSKPEI